MIRLLIILLLIASPAHASGPWVMMAVMKPASYPPNAPTGVTAVALNGQVLLNWSAPSADGSHGAATSYKIYRGTSSGGESATPIATGVSAASYTDSAVTNETAYYYTVKATNAAGDSVSYSSEATVMPSASAAYSFEARVTPYTAAGSVAASTNYAHTGSYSMRVPGTATTGNINVASRSTTLPSSGVVQYTRWFMIDGTLATNGFGVLFGFANDSAISTWITSTLVYFGTTVGNSNSGGSNGEGLYFFSTTKSPMATWVGTLSKDVWYKLVVNVDVTNSKSAYAIYDASTNLVYGNPSTYVTSGTGTGAVFPNLSFNDVVYTSVAGSSFNVYVDDVINGQ